MRFGLLSPPRFAVFSLGIPRGGAIGFINKFINSEIEGIYWFFPVIFSVYLAMPVLSLLKDNRKILFYLAGTGFVLKSFLPEFLGYFGIHWNGYIAMDMLGGYLLYAVIGYLAATTDFTKKQRAAIYVAGFLGAALRYVVTLCFSFKTVSSIILCSATTDIIPSFWRSRFLFL